MKDLALYVTGIIIIVAALLYAGQLTRQANFGEAVSGSQSVAASSTQFVMTAGTAVLLTSSSTCSSRVISTQGSEIRVSLDDKVPTLAGFNGHPASTTIVYDGGTYGCGAIRAISSVAQTVSITEER